MQLVLFLGAATCCLQCWQIYIKNLTDFAIINVKTVSNPETIFYTLMFLLLELSSNITRTMQHVIQFNINTTFAVHSYPQYGLYILYLLTFINPIQTGGGGGV